MAELNQHRRIKGSVDPRFVISHLDDDQIQTLPRLLLHHAKECPNEIALRQKEFGIWRSITWRQYADTAIQVANGLARLGLGEGDHVAILSENRWEWLCSQLGINFLGGVPAGLYSTSPANEICYLLEYGDAKAIFCEDQEQVDKVLEVRTKLPNLKQVIVFDTKGLDAYQDPTIISFTQLCQSGINRAKGSTQLIDDFGRRHSPDDIALIVFTSGSTGPPKGALISFRNIAASARATDYFVTLTRNDSVLSYLPLCHVAEQVFSLFLALESRYIVSFGESLRTIQVDLREIAPTLFLGVPRIWEKMHSGVVIKTAESRGFRRWILSLGLKKIEQYGRLHNPKRGVSYWFWYLLLLRPLQNLLGLRKARFCLSSAAPIAEDILSFFRGLGVPVREAYGMTEVTGASFVQPLTGRCEGRVGFVLPGMEYALAEDGELLMRGDNVFLGYYKKPEETRDTLAEGWLHSGDIAKQHPDNSISIIDRKKDIMITAGGKNLTPSVIENTTKASPFIHECIVIGDGRRFVSALIEIDLEIVSNWAENQKLSYTTFKNLTQKGEVIDLIEREVNRTNRSLSDVEKIRRFFLLNKQLDHDDGEVTATMKVRRKQIEKLYQDEIESLYR